MSEILNNKILITVIIAWFSAQLIKTVLYLIMNHRFDFSRIFGSGGMPSSHSASVSALSLACAYQHGLGSFEFAVTFVLAAIVVHDACGVRNEAGKHAKILNELLKTGGTSPDLKELIGHTFTQVIIGIFVGIITAVIIYQI